MSDFSTTCIRCGLFRQTHRGEYPSLCAKCAEYMRDRKLVKVGEILELSEHSKSQGDRAGE